jgi:hypothetical protein
MANYSYSPQREKSNGRWTTTLTYELPDVEGCVSSYDVKLEADSEKELAQELTELIISIKNNK